MELAVRRFDDPDETREMPLGGFDLVHIGGMTVGRASYEPGWKWSEHVGKASGTAFCQSEHLCLVVSGRNRVTMEDGTTLDVGPGDLFTVPPGHDSEVLGDEPYVSLHLMGGESYASG